MRTNPVFLTLLVCIFLSVESQGKYCPISSSQRSIRATNSWQDLKSPGFDGAGYSRNVKCVWNITSQDPMTPIVVQTIVMDLENISGCSGDSVKISDNTGLRGKYCRPPVPVIRSRGGPLLIDFETDSTYNERGFHFRFRMDNSSAGVGNRVISHCSSVGYTVDALGEERYIQSINYPRSYSSNLDCKWILSVRTPGYVVKVVVQDSDLEYSSKCRLDYVTAYDGPSASSPQLRKWCGTQTPTLFSTGQYLTLRFVTDYSVTRKGFRLSFKEVSVRDNSIGIEQCLSSGYSLEAIADERYIQSANYPSSYPKNLDCTWLLRTQTAGYVVKVVVIDSQLEYSSSCSYDSLTAYDGPSDSSTQLQKWCGSQTPTLYSSGQHLTLRFVTDSTTQRRGFKLSFQEIPESQRPSGLSTGAIVGIVFGVLTPLIVCCCVCCCYCCKEEKSEGVVNLSPPRPLNPDNPPPNIGTNGQVFYTSTYAQVTTPTSASAYAPPDYPGPPSQHYPVQRPAYPVGGYTYPQPSAPPQLGGMGGPPPPPTERQESLPSEPPPSYWQASQYELSPGGSTSAAAATAPEAGSGGGQSTAGYRDNPAYSPEGN